MTDSTELQLGYWNIRGLAQPIRFLLEFTGAKWTDVLYCQAGPNDPVPFDKSCWYNVKETIGLDFPNLPYMIDGDVKMTQSRAIMRHIARKRPDMTFLFGRTPEDMDQVDQLMDQFADINGGLVGVQYSAGIDVPYIQGSLTSALKRLSKYLGTKTWFVGDYITLADFLMFEFICRSLDYTGRAGLSDFFSAFPNLLTFHQEFSRLPTIDNYMKSERFAAVTAYNNQHAKWR